MLNSFFEGAIWYLRTVLYSRVHYCTLPHIEGYVFILWSKLREESPSGLAMAARDRLLGGSLTPKMGPPQPVWCWYS